MKIGFDTGFHTLLCMLWVVLSQHQQFMALLLGLVNQINDATLHKHCRVLHQLMLFAWQVLM
jgi:hypothetical protein